jgi:hypothetical protein
LAKIRLKQSNARSLISASEFDRNFSKLAEFRPNRRTKKTTMGRMMANLYDIRPKSVVEIKLHTFDRFETNFGENKITVYVQAKFFLTRYNYLMIAR